VKSGRPFDGRLALQQRVLPNYRIPFFELLADACARLSLAAGLPRPDEGIASAGGLRNAEYTPLSNHHFLRGPLYLCYQAGLTNWLAAADPDVLIAEANPRYLATPAALRWMHARGRRVIGWGLGAPPLAGALAGLRRARRGRFLGQFDALIAYSGRGADEYAALGFPRERIFTACNAVAARPQAAPPARPRAFAGPPVILFIGRLQARKRVDELLRAAAGSGATPRVIIVGDGPERGRLAALAARILPSAEFAGAKFGAELGPYFAQADLFVLPGTGGLAVQEAMTHGLPVIVAKGDGTQDDLVRPSNGWQIPADDEAALRDTLRLALADAGRLRQMGAESYRIVSEEINLERMAAVFVEALHSLVHS
jgi:glycosyltransferase involved in cell wall biosynthesis